MCICMCVRMCVFVCVCVSNCKMKLGFLSYIAFGGIECFDFGALSCDSSTVCFAQSLRMLFVVEV